MLTEGANEISFAKVDGVWYMEDEGAVLSLFLGYTYDAYLGTMFSLSLGALI